MSSTVPLTKPHHCVVEAYSTYFTIPSAASGMFAGNHYDLAPLILNRLRVPIFNQQGLYVDSVRYYRFSNGKFHLPIHALPLFTAELDRLSISDSYFTYEVIAHPANETGSAFIDYPELRMREEWTDRPEHKFAFDHILNYPGAIAGNDLQTGKGKSYVGVKLTTIYHTPTCVLCHGLIDQWVDNFTEKTYVPRERIYELQGIASLKKLWTIINENPENLPWVLVGSIMTMQRYAMYTEESYRELPRINALMEKLHIGQVIYDEVHLNTHAIVLIMLMINVANNTILSATPERSSKQEQAVFKLIFPPGVIGGSAAYDKYVTSCIYGYDLDLRLKEKSFVTFGYGYSHNKYEGHVLNSKTGIYEFYRIVDKHLHSEYLNGREDETKCLIFVSTVRMAVELCKRFSDSYMDLDIRTYLANDPIDNLHEADVIISTPQSCGVGKDIRNLVTVINTVSVSSAPRYKQMFGRLRKLVDKSCKFVDLLNVTVPHQLRHFWSKRKVLRECSKQYTSHGVEEYINKGNPHGQQQTKPKFGYRRSGY